VVFLIASSLFLIDFFVSCLLYLVQVENAAVLSLFVDDAFRNTSRIISSTCSAARISPDSNAALNSADSAKCLRSVASPIPIMAAILASPKPCEAYLYISSGFIFFVDI
jgi:hypothetical protein